jgi:hypothetical protein
VGKWAICDLCGAKDDMNFGEGPILDGGAKLIFWEDYSQTDDPSEGVKIDLCQECKNKLIESHSELAKALEERDYKSSK